MTENVDDIWEKAINLYSNQGVQVRVENPEWAAVTSIDCIKTPLGIAKTDVQIFKDFAGDHHPHKIFVIGNAFGWSVTLLSLLFSGSIIDVIDAEIEHDGRGASDVARKVFSSLQNSNINLYIGLSPQQVPNASVNKPYDLIFIDGEHTKDQVLKDFHAVLDLMSDNCALFFHDVRLLGSTYQEGVEEVFDTLEVKNFDLYKLEKSSRNESGMWVATRGISKKENLKYETIKS
jgi:predicted O-methyltransferase YrrM